MSRPCVPTGPDRGLRTVILARDAAVRRSPDMCGGRRWTPMPRRSEEKVHILENESASHHRCNKRSGESLAHHDKLWPRNVDLLSSGSQGQSGCKGFPDPCPHGARGAQAPAMSRSVLRSSLRPTPAPGERFAESSNLPEMPRSPRAQSLHRRSPQVQRGGTDGMSVHSIVGGSAWEPTPWRAVQRAAWRTVNRQAAA